MINGLVNHFVRKEYLLATYLLIRVRYAANQACSISSTLSKGMLQLQGGSAFKLTAPSKQRFRHVSRHKPSITNSAVLKV